MAETKRFSLTPQLDLQQIIYEAQHRWLRPAEICEILQNYKKFRIEPEPPNRPPSGSLYLFDRKVLRYFRKDGHNWRKKKDGKTVKEAHERLKAGSVDVLHCYYAHGEENENFQRRSYWMLEQNLMHIVLVHYLEVKVGHKLNSNRSRDVEVLQVNPIDSPVCSGSISNYSHVPSLATDVESPNSAQNSEYEDAESDNYQTSSRYDAVIKMQQYDDGQITGIQFSDSYVPGPTIGSQCSIQGTHAAESNSGFSTVTQDALSKVFYETSFGSEFSDSKAQFDLSSWDEVLEHATALQMASFQPSGGFAEPATGKSKVNWDQYDENLIIQDNSSGLGKSALKLVATDADSSGASIINMENGTYMDEMVNHPSLKQPALNILQGEALKKHDSFSRWMSKELGEVEDSLKKSSFGVYWSSVGNDCVVEDSGISSQESVDAYMFSLSLSQDQLFSIIEFSPNWVYAGSKTKVLITGKFLNNEDVFKCKWSCMFGEIEVPAEVVGDGLLCCCAPAHKSGRVPFYVTCSDRLACSEVREFEFREDNSHFTDLTDVLLHIRLDKLLSLGLLDYQTSDTNILENNAQLKNEMSPIKIEATDDWSTLLKLSELNTFSTDNAKDPREALLQDKLDNWLLCKVSEDGKGPNIWDEEGQGVLHLAAALGYDWALEPTVTAGVNINFRDAHGWTALHWAAFCGRERTVGALIAMGAAPGLLTDPTPEFPSGRTPSDLASANGHKGISGFLAESTLTDHLSCLTIESKGNDIPELTTLAGANVVESGSHSLEVADGDVQAGLTLKDSLNAVRNASQAAARIYQAYRVHSFQRKKLVEYRNDKSGVSDERALSLISVKSQKPGQCDMPLHAAAVRIQNKFRGWKGRKEFLVIRQRIVKIQAHVRGHQVRKRYRNVVWSVGIVEKVILRWRRKGSGLRGFRSEGRSEGLLEGNTTQSQPAKEDDYDFLQEGRKQTEARMQKALERVKSMVQYPEAREQYRRLLTVVTEFQESKAMRETIMNESEAADDDFMVELEELWDDHTL